MPIEAVSSRATHDAQTRSTGLVSAPVDEPLAAVRGIFVGLAIAAVMWLLLAATALAVWR